MNKKKILIIITILIIILSSSFLSYKLYNYYRIKNAKIEVVLKDDLTLEFSTKKKVSDYIVNINGKITNDYVIDSSKLGLKDVEVEFVNNDNIPVKYKYQVNIVDTVEPVIWLGSSYSLKVGSKSVITDKVLCGDNHDSNPNCYIEGDYDVNTPGTYPLVFKAVDNSGNVAIQPFNLYVYEPKPSTSTNKKTKSKTYFEDVIKKYKNNDTSIGIDISKWQGDVNFDKLKEAGVEFVIIRVGGTRGPGAEYFLDEKFKQNIEGANRVGIKVGIYFYSYAYDFDSAFKDAEWVLEQIKDYQVDLPIAFDWEEWSSFNEYNLSFFELTSIAETFLTRLEIGGYKGMLYSSKSYLDYIWLPTNYPVWLAHYTEQTTYKGDYKFWQLCDNGRVDGIKGDVDIDIMYK